VIGDVQARRQVERSALACWPGEFVKPILCCVPPVRPRQKNNAQMSIADVHFNRHHVELEVLVQLPLV